MSSSFDKRHCCLLQVFFPNLEDLTGKSSSSISVSSQSEIRMKTAPFPINITIRQAVELIIERDNSRLQQVIAHCNTTGLQLGLWDSSKNSFLRMDFKLSEVYAPGSYTQGIYLKPLPPEESRSTPPYPHTPSPSPSSSPSPLSSSSFVAPAKPPRPMKMPISATSSTVPVLPLPLMKHSPSNDAVSALASEPMSISARQPSTRKKRYSKTYSSSDLMNSIVLPIGPTYSEEDLAPYLTWIAISIEKPMMPAVFLPEVSTDSCVLYCHDHYEDLGSVMNWVQTIRKELGISVLAFEYSGFGLHKGDLDFKNWLENAKSSYNFLTNVKLVPSPGIVVYGKGYGCVVACNLVAELRKNEGRCPAALVLQSISQECLNLARIAPDVGPCPALLIHGELDESVPVKLARKLATNFDAWQLLKVSGAGRTNLQRDDFATVFLPKLKEVLTELSPEPQLKDTEDKHPSRVLVGWLSRNRLDACLGPLTEVGVYSLNSLLHASSITVSLGDPIICKRFEHAVHKAEKILSKTWELHKASHKADRKPLPPKRRRKLKCSAPRWSMAGHKPYCALSPKPSTPVPISVGRTRRRSASVDGTPPVLTRPVPQLTVFVPSLPVESKDDMSTGRKRLPGLSSPFKSFRELVSTRISSPGT